MSVANPDREIRGGGGAHPDPEIRGGGTLQKNFFRPFGPHFRRKIRGVGPRDLPTECSSCSKYSICNITALTATTLMMETSKSCGANHNACSTFLYIGDGVSATKKIFMDGKLFGQLITSE